MKDKQAPQKIDKIYASWKASGLTQVEYCKREEISFTWFKNQAHKKRNRLQSKCDVPVTGRFTAISVNEASPATEDTTKHPYCEITFSGEHTVSFSDKASMNRLKSLISDLIQI